MTTLMAWINSCLCSPPARPRPSVSAPIHLLLKLCHHNDTEYFQICQDCQWQIVRKRKRSAEPERADIVRCGRSRQLAHWVSNSNSEPFGASQLVSNKIG
ncbi:hypothetical protein J6590_082736 [Homalodisca vitripennis]|nr:hypothetical protein J6590_082736 [Homalodisca vitripennis]